MGAEPARFELHVTVSPEDIDRLGHVNNVVYLQWVQDAAAAHWDHVTTPEQRQDIVWVALSHGIEYEAPAFLGQDLVARTWVEAWTGATSERHTEVVRPADGIVVARARTVWCAVDPGSQRPRRVDKALRDRFSATNV